MNTLKAERRDMTVKAKKLRREGFVTGSIFGRELEETIPLKMEKGAVERLLKAEGKGGQVMLEIEGKTYDALIKEVDYNPLKGCIDEIDFQALVAGEKVHSTAEVHLVNLEKLAAGVPQQMLHEIAFKALPSALVDKVEVDVGDMKVGDTLKVSDLPIAHTEGLDLTTDADATVVTITEVHAVPAEDTEDAAAE
mgnify:FL=1